MGGIQSFVNHEKLGELLQKENLPETEHHLISLLQSQAHLTNEKQKQKQKQQKNKRQKSRLNPNYRLHMFKGGISLFWFACHQGQAEVVRLLLQQDRLDINLPKKDTGSTPLFIACEKGHTQVVSLLLQHPELRVNQARKNGVTPLFMACQERKPEIVRLLLERPELDVNSRDLEGNTPLLVACEAGCPLTVRLLLQREDLLVNLGNRDGLTPLIAACRKGDESLVKLLLTRGDLVLTGKTRKGYSGLNLACKRGDLRVVKRILGALHERNLGVEKSVDADVQEFREFPDIVQLIERYRADPHQVGSRLIRELHLREQRAASMFVFMRQSLMNEMEEKEKEVTPAHQFLNIASKLPVELQMVICNRSNQLSQTVIPQKFILEAINAAKQM